MAAHPKILLVEGNQEIRVIPELIEKNGVVWKINDKQTVVHIKGNKGDRELVDADKISTALQSSGLSILGIIIDADENPTRRWESIRNASRQSIPDIPDILPEIVKKTIQVALGDDQRFFHLLVGSR
ncbi:MAG: hypothetical protein HC916_21850 [Coleofasciculaceae cyanobacterium SM2_1_6]|nr:hypothetical protein [Coleofasciculaceae cyanobacterium SM2_1_6]